MVLRLSVISAFLLAGVLADFNNLPLMDRENEPDPRERPLVKIPAVVRSLCDGFRQHLKDESARGNKISSKDDLTDSVMKRIDGDEDNCISASEIRDVAKLFGGSEMGYRVLFEKVLDDDQDGCVNHQELATIVQDCMRPMTKWTREGTHEREYEPLILGSPDEVPEDYLPEDLLLEEVEEEMFAGFENEGAEEEDKEEHRRTEIEEEKKKALDKGVKELICAVLRRRDSEIDNALSKMFSAVEGNMELGLDGNQFYEFLAGARIPRVETDDILIAMDTDTDGMLTTDEIMTAVDNCPVPERVHIPVVDTKPYIREPVIECPTERQQYKFLRTRAMKFLGAYGEERSDVRAMAEAFYASFTGGDIETVISPRDLDIPETCVKECWGELDTNKDGYLDLQEFNHISLDILEEFIEKPAREEQRKTRPASIIPEIRLDEVEAMNGADREILTGVVVNTYRELNVRVGEEDALKIAAKLSQNHEVVQLLNKVRDLGPNSEAFDTLRRLVRPIVERLARH